MNNPDAIHGFALSPACPSEAILDAIELDEPVDAPFRAHVQSCAVCVARLKERKDAFAALDRPALVRAIHARVVEAEQAAEKPSLGRSWRRAIAALSVAAAAGVAAVVMIQPVDSERSKGSIGFDVFVEHGGDVRRAARNTVFHAGDRLRFEVDLPVAAHVLIVGVEADGTMYSAYPATASVAAAPKMAGGSDQVLPGAVELDEKPGREVLHLVACDREFGSSDVHQEKGTLVVPAGCVTTPFVLEKVD
jgi:hypothetical protein